MLHRFALAVAMAAATLALWAPGAPANILLGTRSPESLLFVRDCVQACTITQTAVPGGVAASPVDGVIVRWRVFGAAVGKTYRLRVLSPQGGSQFSGVGTSVGTATALKSEFESALPIKAGQRIGVDLEPDGGIAVSGSGAADTLTFRPPLGEGVIATGIAGTGELGLQAEVQQAPTITSVEPASGSVGGGDSVVIGGTELQGATSVRFGSTEATEFGVDSEEQITVVAPEAGAPTTVPISVTTLAGTATSGTSYTYVAEREERRDGGEGGDGLGSTCVVPKLKGKKLKGSKARLRAARCRLGKVRKKAGATAKRGRVVKQSPRPGKVLAPGAKVNVTLRPTT